MPAQKGIRRMARAVSALAVACAIGGCGTAEPAVDQSMSGRAPACPASLVGLTWIGSGFEAARLDPRTGVVTKLGLVPTVGVAFTAYDWTTRRIYVFGEGAIHAVDGVTGEVLFTTPLSPDITNQIYNPEVNDAGAIVFLKLGQGPTGTAKLDPMTGDIVDLASTPHNGGYGQGMSAFDRATNHVYQLGDGFLVTLDGATGVVLADTPVEDDGFFAPQAARPGELFGVHGSFGGFRAARLDLATALITDLQPIPGAFSLGLSTFDPCTGHFLQLTSDGVLTIDTASGAVITTVPLSDPGFGNIEAVW